jgi:hypothetical protein
MCLFTEYACDLILITYKKRKKEKNERVYMWLSVLHFVDGGLVNKVLGLTLGWVGWKIHNFVCFAVISLAARWSISRLK